MKEKQNLLKKLLTGLLITAITLCMTACSGISINFDALKEMLSPYDPNKEIQEPQETPDVPETPEEPEIPVEPEEPEKPETPVEPEQPEEPEEPFIPTTEEEFKVACKEKFEEIAVDAIQLRLNSKILSAKMLSYNFKNGVLYCTADAEKGKTYTYFFKLKINQIISDSSYEKAFESIKKINVRQTNFEYESVLKVKVSEESYNALCEYVLKEVGLEGAEVLNVKPFMPTVGGYYTDLIVTNGDRLYNIQAITYGECNNNEECIDCMLNNSDNLVFKTSEEEFKSFDEIGSVPLD